MPPYTGFCYNCQKKKLGYHKYFGSLTRRFLCLACIKAVRDMLIANAKES